jgi:hypothetical protein
MKTRYISVFSLALFLSSEISTAQDLDPRAYVWLPKDLTILVAGYSYSHGSVLTDPSLPLKDLVATINAPSIAVGRTLNVLRKTAQVTVALPFAWADATAEVGGTTRGASRTGFSDMRVRFSILLHGAPAATVAEIVSAKRRTIIGTSLTVITPTGQYYEDRLINLGTKRWSFKPEVALSQPLGNRWLVDVFAGVWLFTRNDSYYPGTSSRSQNPLVSYQAHFSYNIQPRLWAALDLTYYNGGGATIDGVAKNDAQSNSRIGGTLVLPVRKRHSIKIAYSKGAIIRRGANFSTISIGWQSSFFKKPKA